MMMILESVYSTFGLAIELYWLGVKIFLAFVESAYRCVHPRPLKRLNTEKVLVSKRVTFVGFFFTYTLVEIIRGIM